MRLAIYGKAGCCLCDNAEEIVRHLRREYTFEMERVDITHDLGLYDRYREAIPVLTLDGVEIARGRVAIAAVRTAFVKAARSVQI
ncbi:MAG TPA: glutaredoxin family protein [bacterium]|nr:glutaredoxin family protein [bacterium]